MTIEELIAALEKAEGPSLDLDGAIEVQVRRFEAAASGLEEKHWAKWQHYGNHVFEGGSEYDAEHFTGSLDAAVVLVDRVLPDWRIENLCEWDAEILRDQGPWMCDLVQRRLKFFDRQSAKCSHAPTAALAVLIALLKANLSQENTNVKN